MASNSSGTLFRITTFGESHGSCIGVVIDGCPAGLQLDEEIIQQALKERSPGRSAYTSPRKEPDQAEIVSGLFEGRATGAPICILIQNRDADPSKYEPIKQLLRPGHANFTYLAKYGIFDYRGGGRASARETAARVAAGAVARQLLAKHGVKVAAFLKSVGDVEASMEGDLADLRERRQESAIFCPDSVAEAKICELITQLKAEGDSVGGVVEMRAEGVPAGLGDPVYDKMDACLAQALMSLPAVKGFEIGSGFQAANMLGSEHNDRFTTSTNHAGGVLAGITTGMPLIARIALKPPSSIRIAQSTLDLDSKPALLSLPPGSRHDPCVAIRAVPVAEAVLALVLADRLLMNQTSQLEYDHPHRQLRQLHSQPLSADRSSS